MRMLSVVVVIAIAMPALAKPLDANGNGVKLVPYVDPVFPAQQKKPRPVTGGVRCACVKPLLYASA